MHEQQTAFGMAVGFELPSLTTAGTVTRLLSFEEVYRLNHEAVFRFCATQVGNQTVAEDIAAETFKKAFVAYNRVRPHPDGVRTWLFTIAHNLVKNDRRSRKRWYRAFARLEREPDHLLDIESVAATHETVQHCLGAMRSLKERDRTLIGLRGGAGMSYAEIASVMGMSERHARTAGGRAFERLRRAVERTTEGGDPHKAPS